MASYPKPAVRKLNVYAFDPQASVTLATAMINDYTIELPWEERWESPLTAGPVNDYVEVIDFDPAAGLFYAPVDLNHPDLLAQNGLLPSEGRPQFHQQMVFAVVMRTVRAFERALGRVVLWARDQEIGWKDETFSLVERNFTRRLRIYPHALREANAYYSPAKRALLFGYFKPLGSAAEVQAGWVFTCLSQDIIAHETTHAILHGMRQRSIDPSNIDAMAFHEGFADIVAMLQHFSMTNVVCDLLGASGGSLRGPGLLTGLGDQFGRATGRSGALRYALQALSEREDAQQINSRESINAAVEALRTTTEPHKRGAFLVAAVFDAFVTIYERRTADLFRLGQSDLAGGKPIGPDLLRRLAQEATNAAAQVMQMCIRALDYTPPVDLRFGEYLRAIITADIELVPNDPLRYRIAFIEAFKRWGITVPGCISMAPDNLRWDPPRLEDYPAMIAQAIAEAGGPLADPNDALSINFTELLSELQLGISFGAGAASYQASDYTPKSDTSPDASPQNRNLREKAMELVLDNQQRIHRWLAASTSADEDWERLTGMRLLSEDRSEARKKGWKFKDAQPMRSMDCGDAKNLAIAEPKFEVGSARISRRSGPDGNELHLLIIQITQKRRGYFDEAEQAAAEIGNVEVIGAERWIEPDFWFRGGATLHVDLRDGRLLRIIRKRIDNHDRLEEERAFRTGETTGFGVAPSSAAAAEPFAFMHRSA